MPKYCLVENCRYPQYHITSGHQCTCGQFGHGRLECRNQQKMNELMRKVNESNLSLPAHMHCTIPDCNYRYSHTNASHVCSICSQREHGETTCPYKNQNQNQNQNQSEYYQIECPMCRTKNKVSKSQKPIVGASIDCVVCYNKANMYLPQCGHINICLDCIKNIEKQKNNNTNHTNNIDIEPSQKIIEFGRSLNRIFYLGTNGLGDNEMLKKRVKDIFGTRPGKICLCSDAGMGCLLFIRRHDVNADIEMFFMHSDSWGQYGYSEVGELNNFVEDYEPIYNNQ
jgi:hypothetical protein